MVLDPSQEKIATVLFEYEQAKRELGFRKREANRVGQLLISAGKTLSQTPGFVRFLGDTIPEQYRNPAIGGDFDPKDFDSGKLMALTFGIRELEMKLALLATERQNLGYPL